MTTLKLISLLAFSLTSTAFAGGGGGGGVLPEAWVMQERPYVYNMGQKNGQTKFKVGQWSNAGQWQTKDFSVWGSVMSGAYSNALNESMMIGDWAKVR